MAWLAEFSGLCGQHSLAETRNGVRRCAGWGNERWKGWKMRSMRCILDLEARLKVRLEARVTLHSKWDCALLNFNFDFDFTFDILSSLIFPRILLTRTESSSPAFNAVGTSYNSSDSPAAYSFRCRPWPQPASPSLQPLPVLALCTSLDLVLDTPDLWNAAPQGRKRQSRKQSIKAKVDESLLTRTMTAITHPPSHLSR